MPVQYVIGYVKIEGLKILVDKSVLIPRPETIDLCKWVIQEELNDKQILDIGTGSGLISLFLKKHSKNCTIHAWSLTYLEYYVKLYFQLFLTQSWSDSWGFGLP